MSERYKIVDQNGMYFVTLTIVGWVDIFTRKEYCDMIIDSLKYCQEHKQLVIYGYVIMSNHVHLIVRSDDPRGLSATLRDFKAFTAKEILKLVYLPSESRQDWMKHVFKFYAGSEKREQEHMVWKHGNHPIILFTEKVARQKLKYIHDNPIRAGLVNSREAWFYSSISNYLGMPAPINVTLLDAAYRV